MCVSYCCCFYILRCFISDFSTVGKFRSVSSWKTSSDKVVLIQHADSFLTFFPSLFQILKYYQLFFFFHGGAGQVGQVGELFSLQIQFTF